MDLLPSGDRLLPQDLIKIFCDLPENNFEIDFFLDESIDDNVLSDGKSVLT